MRGSGALSPLALLYAAGGMALVRLVPHAAARRYGPPLLLAALLLLSGGLTARDYFIRWPSLPKFGDRFVAHVAPGERAPQTTAEVLARLLPDSTPEHPILISYLQYTQPHTVYAIGPTTPDAVSPVLSSDGMATNIRFVLEKSFDSRAPMVLVWQEEVIKATPVEPLAPADAEAVRTLCDKTPVIPAPGYQTDAPEVCTGLVPSTARLQARTIENPLDIRFQNGVRLMGYNLTREKEVGAADEESSRIYRLTLFWKLHGPVDVSEVAASTIFVRLANDQGVWGADTRVLPEGHLFDWLRPGADRILETSHNISTPPDMPSGKVHFEVGLLDPATGTDPATADRIGVLDDQGRVAADQVNLGAVMIGDAAP
jgi:hypothetical protein